jgi:hypothetical protein
MSRIKLFVVGGLVLSSLAQGGCSGCNEEYYCDETGCFWCDSYGCRPVDPPEVAECSHGDWECPADRPFCTADGYCVATCSTDEECPTGLRCVEGFCLLPDAVTPPPLPADRRRQLLRGHRLRRRPDLRYRGAHLRDAACGRGDGRQRHRRRHRRSSASSSAVPQQRRVPGALPVHRRRVHAALRDERRVRPGLRVRRRLLHQPRRLGCPSRRSSVFPPIDSRTPSGLSSRPGGGG